MSGADDSPWRKKGERQHVARRDATVPTGSSSKGAIDQFLQAARKIVPQSGGGRLVFALDATMSRQPTWDAACRLQAEMFDAVGRAGNLNVQLVYFRGYGECRASRWVSDTDRLRELMTRIDCRGGQTQIGKILKHVRDETQKKQVSAAVYIGDAMEENVDALCETAGELGLRKVPCFMFQEGHDPAAQTAFREIARLSGGAYVRFDNNAAGELAELLKAVATYASGGLKALESSGTRSSRLLLEQLSGGRSGA
jgi:hypothetical protein